MFIIGPSLSIFSSYWRDVCVGSLVEPPRSLKWTSLWHGTPFLPLSQQFMQSPSMKALAKNSLMTLAWTFPNGFNSFVHVLFLNTSGMKVFSTDSLHSPFQDDRGLFVVVVCRPCLHQHFENYPRKCVDALRTSLWLIA